MTDINLPEGLTTIGKDAFSGTALQSISIPGSVTTINRIFDGCSKLTDIKLSEGTTTIGAAAFFGLHIKTLVIPNSVTSIQQEACTLCKDLESLTIGKNVTEIGYNAFDLCLNLKRVRVLADVPPTCANSFDQISADVVLEVPSASIEAYSKAEGWKNFAKIETSTQCETPTITVADGKILLECATKDATIHYEVKGSGEMTSGEFTFPSTYEISAYATLEGIQPSEPVSEKIYLPVYADGPNGGVTEIYIYDDSHTDITLTTGDVITLFIKNGVIHLENVPHNAQISVYSIAGETLMTQLALEETIDIKLPRNDTYIIKVGEKSFKVKI